MSNFPQKDISLLLSEEMLPDVERLAQGWLDSCGQPSDALTWADYHRLVRGLSDIVGQPDSIERIHWSRSIELRSSRFGSVPISCARWNGPDVPPLICLGGIAATARRFDFLGKSLRGLRPVIALDWPGRGLSGWLAEQSDYAPKSYLDMLCHCIDSLTTGKVDLLGSSLGGSVAMTYASRHPDRVRSLILNDTGACIPKERRSRRAQAVGRHYVFRTPQDLFRRLGAASKNSGRVGDAVLLHNAHHGTHWSEAEQARIYRHDIRALLAYRDEANEDLDLWSEWQSLEVPVLILHGLQSDALSEPTLRTMAEHRPYALVQVPDSGHTPALSSHDQIASIHDWLVSPTSDRSTLRLRERPDPARRYFRHDLR